MKAQIAASVGVKLPGLRPGKTGYPVTTTYIPPVADAARSRTVSDTAAKARKPTRSIDI
jgi:hypothetical protein